MKRIFFVFISFIILTNTAFSQLIINEVMPANGKSYLDDDGENSDWIELKNVSTSAVNLSDYFISDKNKASSFKQLPDRTLAPGEFVVLWASDKPKDRTIPNELSCDGGGFFGYWSRFDTGFFYFDGASDSVATATMRVHFVKSVGGQSQIGLIVRESLDSTSKYSGVFVSEEMKCYLHVNPSTNQDVEQKWFSWDRILLDFDFPSIYIRLEYRDDSVYCASSIDKVWWMQHSAVYLPLQKPFYAGLAFGPNCQGGSVAYFSELSINGKEYPDGLPFNRNYSQKNFCTQQKSPAIHLPIKLSTDKEGVFLANKDKKVIDSISWVNAIGDVSIGKSITDGRIVRFDCPSPNAENGPGYRTQAAMPKLNLQTNYYTKPISVALEGTNPELFARYTVDCTEPTASSPVMSSAPIGIDSNSCLRVRYYSAADTIMPSATLTNTYIYDAPTALPVFSVVTDPKYLWSDTLGILFEGDSVRNKPSNIWQDWERPASVTLLRGGKEVFSQTLGISLRSGTGGRILPQKPFNFSARSDYGYSDISAQLFESKPLEKYKKFMLRNSSQDWSLASIRDVLSCEISRGLNIEHREFFPCRMFLNGKYWGLYYAQEKTDDHFIADNFDCANEDISIIDVAGFPENGTSASYRAMIDSMAVSDMANDSIFDLRTKVLDLDNFVDYTAHEIIIGNGDWPGSNLKLWRNEASQSKWRFILYDSDLTLADAPFDSFERILYPQWTSVTNRPEATFLYRTLFSNKHFTSAFLSRLADMLNSTHRADRIVRLTDSIYSLIREELPAHNARWGNPLANIESEIARIKDFAQKRPNAIRGFAANLIDSSRTYSLWVSSNKPDSLSLDVNTIQNLPGAFDGVYFNNIPVRVILRPAAGLRVKRIEGYSGEVNDTILINTAADTVRINVVLEQAGAPAEQPKIVINEIMYKTCDESDSKDWIEIFNASDFAADLSGWTLSDDKDEDRFALPTGTILEPHGYLAICEDTAKFKTIYPEVNNILGCFDFGFGRGDEVRLFDAVGKLADSLRYDKSSPWPALADGSCYSLELISPDLDNTAPESWNNSVEPKGTPGRPNSRLTPASDISTQVLRATIAPNPVTSRAAIRFEACKSEFATLTLINCLGNTVSEITCPTNGLCELDFSQLPIGAYMIRLSSGTETAVLRFVKQ